MISALVVPAHAAELSQDPALWSEAEVRSAMGELGFLPLGQCEPAPSERCRYLNADQRVIEVSRANVGHGRRMGPLSSDGVAWLVDAPLEEEAGRLLARIQAEPELCPLIPEGLAKLLRDDGYASVQANEGRGTVSLYAHKGERRVAIQASCRALADEDDWRVPRGRFATPMVDGDVDVEVQDLALVAQVEEGLLGFATKARPAEQAWVDWTGRDLALRLETLGWTVQPAPGRSSVVAEQDGKAAVVMISSGSGLPIPTHVYERAGSRVLALTVYDTRLSTDLQFELLRGVDDLCELRRADMASVLADHELRLGRMDRDSFPGCEFGFGTALGEGLVVDISQMCAVADPEAPYGCMPLGTQTPSALQVSVQDERAGQALLQALLEQSPD